MDYKCLGKRIREERNKLRLTQSQLAETINKSESFVGQIERGDSILSLETLMSITNALGTSVDLLLSDSIVRNSEDSEIENEIQLYLNQFSRSEKLFFLNALKLYQESVKGKN